MEVPGHPVGRRNIHFFVAIVCKPEGTGMLQKSINHSPHFDTFAYSSNTRAKTTNTPYKEFNVHPSTSGGIKSHHHIVVYQGIHFGDNASRFASTSIFRLPGDKPQDCFMKPKRGYQQSIPFGGSTITGKQIKE